VFLENKILVGEPHRRRFRVRPRGRLGDYRESGRENVNSILNKID
jgi:hypothetical protein